VFHRNGERIRYFRTAWQNACEAAGCPDALVRDMRRSAVRTFERAGVPRSVAMSIVGHKTESIYRRYAIVDEAQREAAARLDAWVPRRATHAHRDGFNHTGAASAIEVWHLVGSWPMTNRAFSFLANVWLTNLRIYLHLEQR
jgi:hypothetical protein